MPLTNTHQRYGGVTKTFHWLTALLILTLIGLGLYAEDLPVTTDAELARKAWVFSLHKTMGVTVFFVALARILWAITQPHPRLLNADKRAESFLASLAHWTLYGAIVIVPLSGWIGHAAAEGFAPIWWPFGQGLPLVPKDPGVEHLFATIHVIAGKVLIGTILLHVAGALKHHVIDRDATLRRMLPGEPVVGPLPPQRHSRVPALTAALLWVATICIAGAVGLSETEARAESAPALEQVASEWQVQEGSITISVHQFGSDVEGSFADWTADITFDEDAPGQTAGSVTATISIPSLKLGSVTSQALGADFFAAEDHPTATYRGDILRVADGYEVDGALTIRDQSVPLTLPMDLSVDGDTADLRAQVTLDRRDWGIGANVGDEKTLGFDVGVDISLTATRGE